MMNEFNIETLFPYCERRRYAKGSVLYKAGSPGNGLMVLTEGRVKVLTQQASGKLILLYIFMPPELFGFLPFLDEQPYPVTTVALDDVEVMVMERTSLRGAIAESPEVALVLLHTLATKLRHTLDIVRAASSRSAAPMVATAILSLIPPNYTSPPVLFTLPQPSYTFAHDLGLTPETLSRELSKLVTRGVIHRTGAGKYQVLNLDMLRQGAQEMDIV
ncbi:Crp/Fnr family transcriptional regulator [Myxococcota bacterium]|nr:Crp/Fnr family transcriptional regulator [Myxococcota bacterium]